jgi:two-component system chemotaxis response regulator CheB
MSGPLRVLVVDDSATQRAALIALLDADPELEVAGWASNGVEAVTAAARLRPDVITMDLRMPLMDGLEATRRIMQQTPTPIVMVTASAARDDARLAFDALEAGVLAIVDKPLPPTPSPSGAGVSRTAAETRELLRTVKSMAQVKVVRRWTPERLREARAHRPSPATTPSAGPLSPSVSSRPAELAAPAPAAVPPGASAPPLVPLVPPEVVAIGASTGGPQALATILGQLPATFPLPILVVQHIAPGFAEGLVEWLRTLTPLPVHLAEEGRRLDGGAVWVAPTGRHLVVRARTLAGTDDPPVSGHRPSATVLFQSVAREYRAAAAGILLSGMGDDGAAGLRDLKRAGAVTIAQDEASSVVFGMPAVAIRMGVVDRVLPPAEIPALLVSLATRQR